MTITKDFFLTPIWDDGAADAVDGFCEEVVAEQVERRTGTYTGNGASHAIPFAQCRRTPSLLVLTKVADGTTATVTIPLGAGHVTAWTKSNFTLRDASTFNSAGIQYQFFLIA